MGKSYPKVAWSEMGKRKSERVWLDRVGFGGYCYGGLFLLLREGHDVIYLDGARTSNYWCLGGITSEEIHNIDHALVRASLKSHGDLGYGVDDFFAGTVNRENITLFEA